MDQSHNEEQIFYYQKRCDLYVALIYRLTNSFSYKTYAWYRSGRVTKTIEQFYKSLNDNRINSLINYLDDLFKSGDLVIEMESYKWDKIIKEIYSVCGLSIDNSDLYQMSSNFILCPITSLKDLLNNYKESKEKLESLASQKGTEDTIPYVDTKNIDDNVLIDEQMAKYYNEKRFKQSLENMNFSSIAKPVTTNEEEKDHFEEYMEFYKGLSLKEKQKIVLDELKEISYYTYKMCSNLGINNKVILNREQLDTNNDNYTEDDYSEALVVYIGSIKDSLSAFTDQISNKNE